MQKQSIAIVKRNISNCRSVPVMVSVSNDVRECILPAPRKTHGFLRRYLANTLVKLLFGLVAFSLVFSCKKQHLQPAPDNPEPLVYISAKLDGDSVYFAG